MDNNRSIPSWVTPLVVVLGLVIIPAFIAALTCWLLPFSS
jgi:hypothetical protein